MVFSLNKYFINKFSSSINKNCHEYDMDIKLLAGKDVKDELENI
jgi:hypothetical protein